MAKAHDFFILGDHESGKHLVASALQSEGFTVTTTPTGGLLAKRGSTTATVLLGGLAGNNFQITFTVDFMVDEQGRLVARLNRNMSGGALKGGAIGASKTDTAFQRTANTIGAALHGAGTLADSISQV
ncbi:MULTISPECIES: hypothetical protein [unclassified Leifsonia]|uniref:hypothetical protein n=1 Tax=unclassified Leifsonia TaxID=2663824 RepID=UPI000A18E3C7|nr:MULTISPECIES: hypothetical protein [unclassified Leifsonia]QJA00025.1 hypothetical protein HF024_16960 [Leifsonia sp. PS1209]